MKGEGIWPQDCIQRAFVEGAQWRQFHHDGSTMFGSERLEAEAEAVKRYGEPEGFAEAMRAKVVAGGMEND